LGELVRQHAAQRLCPRLGGVRWGCGGRGADVADEVHEGGGVAGSHRTLQSQLTAKSDRFCPPSRFALDSFQAALSAPSGIPTWTAIEAPTDAPGHVARFSPTPRVPGGPQDAFTASAESRKTASYVTFRQKPRVEPCSLQTTR
jgi:hypothetical protein